jgi:hypothetical protein
VRSPPAKGVTLASLIATGIVLLLRGTVRLDREYKTLERRCEDERAAHARHVADLVIANDKRCDDLKQQISEEKRKSFEATQKWEQALSNVAQRFGAATQTTKEAVHLAERLADASRNNNLPGGPT